MGARPAWVLLVLSACSGQKLHAVTPIESPAGDLATGHFQMEKLSRGVVAVQVEGGVYVGWRMFGYEYAPEDPGNVAYDLYRNGNWLATIAAVALVIGYGVVLLVSGLRRFFDLVPLPTAINIGLIVLTALWVALQRAMWRSRWLERFLDMEESIPLEV